MTAEGADNTDIVAMPSSAASASLSACGSGNDQAAQPCRAAFFPNPRASLAGDANKFQPFSGVRVDGQHKADPRRVKLVL